MVVDKPVTDAEMTRLAKVFKRDRIEVKSEGYLNNLELRFPNEPARHKLLDVVGDLALIGYPIKARIIANRPGHSTNVEFAKEDQTIHQKEQACKRCSCLRSFHATGIYAGKDRKNITSPPSIFVCR